MNQPCHQHQQSQYPQCQPQYQPSTAPPPASVSVSIADSGEPSPPPSQVATLWAFDWNSLASKTRQSAATAWDWLVWSGGQTYDKMEFAGEVIADFLGLTHSEYQWMLDLQEREREEKQLRSLEAKQRRQLQLQRLLDQEKARLRDLESGTLKHDDQLARAS